MKTVKYLFFFTLYGTDLSDSIAHLLLKNLIVAAITINIPTTNNKRPESSVDNED